MTNVARKELPAFLVSPRTACLLAVYCTIFGVATYELHEPKLMITPLPRSWACRSGREAYFCASWVRIWRDTDRTQRSVPLTFMLKKRLNSSSEAEAISAGAWTPIC